MAARALRLSGDWPQAGVGRERTLIERRQCPGLISPSSPSAAHANSGHGTLAMRGTDALATSLAS
jgi:hypothetical protein